MTRNWWGSINQTCVWGAIGSFVWVFSPSVIMAQITPDSTLGTQVNGSAIVPCTGGNCIITNGTIRGRNLFHSFQQFSLSAPGDRATFQSGDEIRNIFARVTGGSASFINGTLWTDSGSVNLYLLNPNGIRFGPGAELRVGSRNRGTAGSFVATTLDAIMFPDGSQFSATNPGDASSLLTVVGDPSGFIASQRQPGAIQTVGSRLGVYEGNSLILLGGDLSFDSVDSTPTGQNSSLFIQDLLGGQITFGSVAGSETVQLVPVGISGNLLTLNFPKGLARGDVTFKNRTEVNVFAESGGNISIYGRNINILSGSRLKGGIVKKGPQAGDLTLDAQAGDLTLDATESITVSGVTQGGNTQILNLVNVDAVGNAGNILIMARSLFVTDGGEINSSTFGEGKAGNIIINAPTILLDAGYQGYGIFSGMDSPKPGKGGNISITSDTLSLTNGSTLNTSTTGEGNAGDIRIDTRSLSVAKGAKISADASGNGLNAGNVVINAKETIQVDGFGTDPSGNVRLNVNRDPLLSQISSGSFSNRGEGGSIQINSRSLTLTNGGELTVNTFSDKNAGNIILNVQDQIMLTGQFKQDGFEAQKSGLFAITYSTGAGGNIETTSRALVIQDGAEIAVRSGSGGKAGDMTLRADQIKLSDRASITATTSSSQGGNITLNLNDSLLLRRNSGISTSAGLAGAGGDGGNITINSKFVVAVPAENSDIQANAFTGKGGSVNITTQRLFGIIPLSQPNDLLSDITASSKSNLNGTVSINALAIDPNQGLQAIPSDLVDSSSLIVPSCAPSSDREVSRFVSIGRGGLPPNPNEALSGSSGVWQDTRASTSSAGKSEAKPLPAVTPAPLIEATNWVRTKNGSIKFVAQPVNAPTNAFLALSQAKGCYAP
jgi:filamentous hemagglutinin family protein